MARTPDEGQARDERVQVRITPELRAKIDAERGGVKMSAWLRQVIEERVAAK